MVERKNVEDNASCRTSRASDQDSGDEELRGQLSSWIRERAISRAKDIQQWHGGSEVVRDETRDDAWRSVTFAQPGTGATSINLGER
jgi:hypothetical protein